MKIIKSFTTLDKVPDNAIFLCMREKRNPESVELFFYFLIEVK